MTTTLPRPPGEPPSRNPGSTAGSTFVFHWWLDKTLLNEMMFICGELTALWRVDHFLCGELPLIVWRVG